MNESYKNVVLINGSPKIKEEAVSGFLLSCVEEQLHTFSCRTTMVNIRDSITKKNTENDFEKIRNADAIIFAFPLYVFCLPGILMRFLQDYYAYHLRHKELAGDAKVYVIVNCGFPEPDINTEAVRVIQSFCRKISADYRFALLVGGGPMLIGAKDAPFVKKEIDRIKNAVAKDIQAGGEHTGENIMVRFRFPKRLYLFIADMGWRQLGRKNGIRGKEFYRRPYSSD